MGKQYNFICEKYHDNYFDDLNNPPFKCSECSVAFEEDRVKVVDIKNINEIKGLTLIYQKTNEKIEIGVEGKVLLGRNYVGKDIFSKILIWNGREMAPVISKTHCSITFIEGYFKLTDEGSTNGTFYSENKHNCKSSPQIIEDKSIIYIGQEEFLAIINYQEQKQEIISQPILQGTEEGKVVKLYICNTPQCGFETISKIPYCPKCKAKKLIPIYE